MNKHLIFVNGISHFGSTLINLILFNTSIAISADQIESIFNLFKIKKQFGES